MSTSSKVVMITGATSGMGEATALLLAERGGRLVLGARRPDPWRRWRPGWWRRASRSHTPPPMSVAAPI